MLCTGKNAPTMVGNENLCNLIPSKVGRRRVITMSFSEVFFVKVTSFIHGRNWIDDHKEKRKSKELGKKFTLDLGYS